MLDTIDTYVQATIKPHHSERQLKSRSDRLSGKDGNINILLDGTTTYTDSANEVPIMIIDRLAAREDYQSVVRSLETPEIVTGAGLRTVVQAVRGKLAIEECDGLGLLLGHVDAAVVGVVHVNESDELSGGVHDGDVLEDTNRALAGSYPPIPTYTRHSAAENKATRREHAPVGMSGHLIQELWD